MLIELLAEPKVEFGNNFLSDDPKMGIKVGGFFSTSSSHRSEIHYGIVGTNNNIELLKDWILKLDNYIESEKEIRETERSFNINDEGEVLPLFVNEEDGSEVIKAEFKNKKLNPDFPGLGINSPFGCVFKNDKMNNSKITEENINTVLDKKKSSINKFEEIVEIYKDAYKQLLEKSISKPNICFVVIGKDVYKKLKTVRIGKQKLNLRRRLKAELLSVKNCIPVQIILEDTLDGSKKSLQDLSMIAWNFVVAQYYKSNGIPWALTNVDKNTCYIGITFHKILNSKSNYVRSSIAQAFNYEGKGLIFIGKQFEWDVKKKKTKAPHLSYDYSKSLVEQILSMYKKYNNHTPSRVVIHKTTNFWSKKQDEKYCEIEGFNDGIHAVLGEKIDVDLITIRNTKVKLLRWNAKKYPVIRGTFMKMTNRTGILYTTGYIPYYETFPGSHVPQPLQIDIYQGDSTLREICTEILAFTKMNFNNCSYFDGLPITIRFAQRVGEIMTYLNDDIEPPNLYYFYM